MDKNKVERITQAQSIEDGLDKANDLLSRLNKVGNRVENISYSLQSKTSNDEEDARKDRLQPQTVLPRLQYLLNLLEDEVIHLESDTTDIESVIGTPETESKKPAKAKREDH